MSTYTWGPSIALGAALFALAPPAAAQVTAIRAGRLVDPEAGTAAANQVILIEQGRFTAVGANVAVPRGAEVIDLSDLVVLPGLVDAHNHLALTYKEEPENNVYYLTYVLDGTPLRAIQAVSNGIQMLNAGFTIVRDMGNAGNYADAALRQVIEQGWIPRPTIINSGIIIGGMGGQFWPTPEMAAWPPRYWGTTTSTLRVSGPPRHPLSPTLCAGREIGACRLAPPSPPSRSYGHGRADLPHRRHGAGAPRRREPLRDGSRRAAGGDPSPARRPSVCGDKPKARTFDWQQMKTLLLAIEVLSPSTRRYDRFTERRVYQEFGVPWYWMVDIEGRALEVWTPEASLPAIERERLVWQSQGAVEPLMIPLADILPPV